MEAVAAKPKQKAAEKEVIERGDGGQGRNRSLLKALVIGPVLKQDLTTGLPKSLPDTDDLIDQLASDGKIIEPPFDKLVLAMLPENSTELYPVIAAMQQNIDGFGYRLEQRSKVADGQNPDEVPPEVLEERVAITNFLECACEDPPSFTELRKRTRYDLETTGEAYWEIVRTVNGDIAELNHIPSYQIRLGVQDREFTMYTRMTPMLKLDGTTEIVPKIRHKRFRSFVQARVRGLGRMHVNIRGFRHRWFKEFGDPRVMNNETGEYVSDEAAAELPEAKKASELIRFKIYSPRTPYGLPRFIGNIITLFGDRAADEINYITLKNNNIPSMAILISNGQLTEGSIARIQEFVETQVQGSDNYSRFLVLESEGQFEGGMDVGNQRIQITPLTEQQMRDQLFQEYSKNNREKIRENFRLPPIFVGRSDEYTRSTAEASRKLADEQVFKPERDEFDNTINSVLFPELGFKHHKMRSNGPNVTADGDLISVMTGGEKTGAITPRIARNLLKDILNADELPGLDESINLDIPFSLQLAEAIKNTAGVDSQLAVKDALGLSPGSILKSLLDFREDLERELARRDDDKR